MKQVFMYIENNHEIPRDQKHMEIRIDEVTTSEEDTKEFRYFSR